MKASCVIAVTCAILVGMTTLMSEANMCEHLTLNIQGKKIQCCFNDICCHDYETMCRKVELSEGRLEILPVEDSFVTCALAQRKDRVCCDNLSSACDCPDGYVMCEEEET